MNIPTSKSSAKSLALHPPGLSVSYKPSTGVVLSDSPKIAKYPDKAYLGTPKVLPFDTVGLQFAYLQALASIIGPLSATDVVSTTFILKFVNEVLFRATREKQFGRPLEDIALGAEEKVATLKKVEEEYAQFTQWYAKEDGPLVMGSTLYHSQTSLRRSWCIARLSMGRSPKDSEEWELVERWAALLKKLENYLLIA